MKGTFYILMAILAFGSMHGNAHANTVLGSVSCKQWQDKRSQPADVESYAIWLNGYLSGANATYGDMLGRDFIKNSDKISIVDWTDAYCQKYPKSMLEDSANALIKRLIKDLPF
ncbi:hypothetical protein GALL_38600 [mine drainage metagenome]|uniref:HdeA/HdeB family protein n=1 Tax=mine drainage metagenome TaxID=410659 RepID=A0A1J5T3R1_9ZZZZ